ncbi:unnamed protein product [Sphagnum balticum]
MPPGQGQYQNMKGYHPIQGGNRGGAHILVTPHSRALPSVLYLGGGPLNIHQALTILVQSNIKSLMGQLEAFHMALADEVSGV